jgi:hypothetical protein
LNITYTQHALDRMAERGISQAQVETTIAAPIATIVANLIAQENRSYCVYW